MAPIWLAWVTSPPLIRLFDRSADVTSLYSSSTSTPDSMVAQWRNPGDILSILLLLGPDVVQCAIAQLAGRVITPVAFSFGWVAYAMHALLSSFGGAVIFLTNLSILFLPLYAYTDGRLMPESEADITVVNTISGHVRTTRNWVLARLLRDFNDRLDKKMTDEQPHISSDNGDKREQVSTNDEKGKGVKKPFEGLRVTVFEVEESPPTKHGVPTLDWVWYSGFAVIIVQLGISAIPWAVKSQWDTFLVTAAGTLLALIGGSLPQWRREKWACPRKGGDTATITEGNGSRSAIVVLGKKGVGLKFEVLARGTRMAPATLLTRIATPILAVFWILLLIIVAGMKQDTWYLLGIGLLGSIQNLIAAGVRRSSAALGIHIKHVKTFRARYVSETLKQVEQEYPLVGTSLVSVFFPGSMRIPPEKTEDIAFWRAALEVRYKETKHGIRLDRLPPAT